MNYSRKHTADLLRDLHHYSRQIFQLTDAQNQMGGGNIESTLAMYFNAVQMAQNQLLNTKIGNLSPSSLAKINDILCRLKECIDRYYAKKYQPVSVAPTVPVSIPSVPTPPSTPMSTIGVVPVGAPSAPPITFPVVPPSVPSSPSPPAITLPILPAPPAPSTVPKDDKVEVEEDEDIPFFPRDMKPEHSSFSYANGNIKFNDLVQCQVAEGINFKKFRVAGFQSTPQNRGNSKPDILFGFDHQGNRVSYAGDFCRVIPESESKEDVEEKETKE